MINARESFGRKIYWRTTKELDISAPYQRRHFAEYVKSILEIQRGKGHTFAMFINQKKKEKQSMRDQMSFSKSHVNSANRKFIL